MPDANVQKLIYQNLLYRKNGRGRCLRRAIKALGLPKGARLEPSAALQDVGKFEVTSCPFRCTFYIAGKHGRALHISPFMQIPGMSLETWGIDILHTWHFGPMSSFICYVLKHLLQSPIWKPTIPGLDKEESDKLSLLALKAEMWTYYKLRRQQDARWREKGSEAGIPIS